MGEREGGRKRKRERERERERREREREREREKVRQDILLDFKKKETDPAHRAREPNGIIEWMEIYTNLASLITIHGYEIDLRTHSQTRSRKGFVFLELENHSHRLSDR